MRELMGGAPVEVWHRVLALDECNVGVYCYDANTKSVTMNSAMCWPVRFLLSCYNRKHAFVGSSMPPCEEVSRAVGPTRNLLIG